MVAPLGSAPGFQLEGYAGVRRRDSGTPEPVLSRKCRRRRRFPMYDCGVDCTRRSKNRPRVAALLSTPQMSGLRRCEAAHILANAHPGTMKLNPNAAILGFRCRRKKPMEYADRVLKCVDCNAEFVFTAGEQFFFREKQFKNSPKRCNGC